MINHRRTLILNETAGTPHDPVAPWALYVPAEYRSLEYPEWLEFIRQVLLGFNISQQHWNVTHRLEELMALIFSSRFVDLAVFPDDRITEASTSIYEFVYTDSVVPFNNLAQTGEAFLLKQADLSSRVKHIFRRYDVTIETPTAVKVLDRVTGISFAADLLLDTSTGGYQSVAVAADLGLRFGGPFGAQPTGGTWRVESATKQIPLLSTFPAEYASIPREYIKKLFINERYQDLLDIYHKLAFDSQFLDDQVAGVVLAFIVQAHVIFEDTASPDVPAVVNPPVIEEFPPLEPPPPSESSSEEPFPVVTPSVSVSSSTSFSLSSSSSSSLSIQQDMFFALSQDDDQLLSACEIDVKIPADPFPPGGHIDFEWSNLNWDTDNPPGGVNPPFSAWWTWIILPAGAPFDQYDLDVRLDVNVFGDAPGDPFTVINYYYSKTETCGGFDYHGFLAEPGLQQVTFVDRIRGRYASSSSSSSTSVSSSSVSSSSTSVSSISVSSSSTSFSLSSSSSTSFSFSLSSSSSSSTSLSPDQMYFVITENDADVLTNSPPGYQVHGPILPLMTGVDQIWPALGIDTTNPHPTDGVYSCWWIWIKRFGGGVPPIFDDHVRITGFMLGDNPSVDSPTIVKYYYVKTLPASAGFVYDGYLAEPGLHQCIQVDQVEGRYF